MTRTKVHNFGLIFLVAAILVMILSLDITWWVAILVGLLARADFKVTTTERRRYR